MIYLPDDWIVDKNNREDILNILNKLDTDILEENNYSVDQAINNLIKLGELKIIEKLKDDAFSFGA